MLLKPFLPKTRTVEPYLLKNRNSKAFEGRSVWFWQIHPTLTDLKMHPSASPPALNFEKKVLKIKEIFRGKGNTHADCKGRKDCAASSVSVRGD